MRHHAAAPRRGALASASAALVAAASLAACTPTPEPTPTPTTSTPTPSPTASPSPTPSIDPTIAAAEAGALEAYRGFWAAKVVYLAAPNETEPETLRQYAVDKALADTRAAARLFQDNGIVATGAPALSPTVTGVDLEGEPTVTITDCVDITDWQPIYADTGDSAAAPGQLDRQLTDSVAFFFGDHWVVQESTVHRDRSC